ncbi:MAG: hypothetical protein U0573_01710 [Phycisphaerales bacterium]|nr:hypothetical protein [Planctomycetota bacterium]
MMNRVFSASAMLAWSIVASAAPVTASFTSGSVTGAGFPEPLAQQPPVSLSNKRSGGGSTGGGFGGTALGTIQISPTEQTTEVALTGTATHISDFGYTAAYTSQEIVLSLAQASTFSITNQSTTIVSGVSKSFSPVTFQGISGVVTSFTPTRGELTPGTYRIRFGIAAGRPDVFSFSEVSTWYNQFNATGCNTTSVNWKLTLRTPCYGDLNNDSLVDDADFSIFVAAYDILGCAQPGMPSGCPSDFNNDGVVDDADFSLFVVNYDNLLCP